MTLEELKALIDGVELRNFPYKVKIKTDIRDGEVRFHGFERRRRPRMLEVAFEQLIPDRDTGVIRAITVYCGFEEGSAENFSGTETDALDVFVRQKLFEIVTHEVCEAIHYKGSRVFDPHRPEGLGFVPAPAIPEGLFVPK